MQDNDDVMALLDQYDAGILGEEVDGTLRIAFARTCEMVGELVDSLANQDLDLVFPANVGTTLYLNIVPRFDCGDIDSSAYDTFSWLPNKMGLYTMSKKALAGVTLRQLFGQLDHIPLILEDEPGTDLIYVHVQRKGLFKKMRGEKKEAHKPKSSDPKNSLNMTKVCMWVFVLVAMFAIILCEPLHPHNEWVLKILSTIYRKLLTFLSL